MNAELQKPTAKTVTVSLYFALRGASQILLPRYTPLHWWECDMWRLTKADFVDEYEIKLSVADFRADASKVKDSRYEIDPITHAYRKMPSLAKHDLLATDDKGPNRFWFVMPAEIAEQVQIPEWAGLMVFYGRTHPIIQKPAPKRHGRKWDGSKLALYTTFYHRFWNHEAGSKSEIEPSSEFANLLDQEAPL